MMKVLFMAPASSIHTIRWVNALGERGNQIYLVSLPNHKADNTVFHENVVVEYLPCEGLKGYYLNAFRVKAIYKIVSPDVINVHYASGYGTLARVSKLPNIILSVWGSDVYEFPYQSKIKRKILYKNLCYAKHIASTSGVMAEQVKKLIGFREISITPFGVDTGHFNKKSINEKKDFTVILIKTLEPQYGVDTVIKAFAHFKAQIHSNNVRLLIYGKGTQKEELIELCKVLNINDAVQFRGYINNSEVPMVYSESDIACFGSRVESFGVSAVEAMACEVPVIATDADGFTEVIENNVTGFIVRKDDFFEMANKMKYFYMNADIKVSMGKNARKRVEELYSWDNNVEKMIKLYEDVRKL